MRSATLYKLLPSSLRHSLQRHRVLKAPFYREHPISGPFDCRDLDGRGLVDLELGYFFNRIPKAANSTIVVNLARHRFGQELPSRQAKKMFLRPSQLTASDVGRLAGAFKFTFVRNPYDRTLSAYLYRIVNETRCYKGLIPADNGAPPSFADFCSFLENGGLYLDTHWAPQSDLLLIPLDRFDMIGHVEMLTSDLETVLKRIWPALTEVAHLKHLAHATGASDKLERYYDANTRAIVAKLYERDFSAFGYDR